MAALRALVLLVCCGLSAAWQGAGLAVRPAASRSASSAINMKHPEYFTRLQRAQTGRLRLCVSRCACATAPCGQRIQLSGSRYASGCTNGSLAPATADAFLFSASSSACSACSLLMLLPPRALACRSNNHIYGQVIDDSKGEVVCAASTMEKDVREADGANGGNQEAATNVGKRLGERALAKGVTTVAFDRNGKKYHGRVKALADGARSAGLSF